MLGKASPFIKHIFPRACAGETPLLINSGYLSLTARSLGLPILPFLVSIFLLGLGHHALGNLAPEISQGAGPLVVSMQEDNASSWSAPNLNATDVDVGDTLTWSVSSAAANGIATISGSGPNPSTFTYVPNLNFFGSDSFVAQVSDGVLTDSVTVKVNVIPGPSPIFATSVNGAGSVPTQTVLAAVGSMTSVTSTSAPVGTTPPFPLTATRGSMTDVSIVAGPVGTAPAFQLEGVAGSMGNLSVSTSVVASTPSFQLTPVGGSMTSIQVTGPWSVFSYSGEGSGFFPGKTAEVSLLFVPNFPDIGGLVTQPSPPDAFVAVDGTLSFTLPSALETGTHLITATPKWYDIPSVSNMGSGYVQGFQPWVKVKRNGIELPTTGPAPVVATGIVGADGKVDITFTGNAVVDVNVTIEVEPVYAFDTMSYSAKGSNYHVSENGGSLSKPVITISPPGGGTNQTVDATVAGNGTLSFTLPSTTTTGGVHTISASAGKYYQLPPTLDVGSGYVPGVHPATTITRNGNAVSAGSSNVTAGADGKVDLTFSGNAGAGPLLVEIAPGSPAWVEGINSINVASSGTNYAVNDLITVSGGGGTGATAKVSSVGSGGEILSVSVVSQGTGYSSSPNATFEPPQKALHAPSLITVASVSASRGQASAGKTIDWSGMSSVQGDDAALQSNNRQHMWAPDHNTSWIEWDFGSLKTVGRMLVWQFNEAEKPNRSIKKAKLEYSEDGADWIDFSANVSSNWPKSSGNVNNHTVVDVDNLNLRARYVRLTGIESHGDSQTGVSEVLFWSPLDASVFSSSISKTTHLAAKAFDDNTSTVWMPEQSALPNVYLTWQFTNPVQVNEYKIMVGDVLPEERSPKDFKLQGSNDNSTWSDLATESNATGWTGDEVRTYSVESLGVYTYYKLLISAAGGDDYLGFREIELWGGSGGSGAVLSANLTTVNTSPFVNQGSGYHPSEHPTIRIPTPTGNDNNQTVTASVAANGKLTFTLPAPLEPEVYTISADFGTYYQLPPVFDRGSGYPSGHSPGVTFKRGGSAVAGMAGSATAAADGKVDSTFTGNAGNSTPVDVQILPGPLAFTPPSFSDQGSSKYHVSETGATAPVITITPPVASGLAAQTVNATVAAYGTLSFTMPAPNTTGEHDVNASFGSVVLLPSGLNGIGSGYLQSGATPAVTITDPLGASRPGTVVTVNANGTLDLDFSSVSPTVAGDYLVNAETIAYPPTPLSNAASGFNPDGFPPIVTFTGADKGTLSANASVNVDGTLNVTFSGAPSGYGNLSLSVTQAPGNLPKTDAEKIIAADSNASDQFGYSVSQSSDFIAVGASGENNNAGAVYLYKSETNGSISYLDKAIAPDRAFSDEFGLSVSQSGNILSVGAWKADLPGKADAGATYLFRIEANGTVTYLQKVVAPDGAAGDGFGLFVSQSGNILSVGARKADLPGKADAGATYLFQVEANGTATYLTKLIAPDGGVGDEFGVSASQSGNILAIGAFKADLPGKADAGATYLYRVEANGTATYLTKLVAPDGGVGDAFGLCLSLAGNTLAIGAFKADLPGKADAGATYLFRVEANGTATYFDKLLAPDGNAGDEFGLSVSQSGNILTVGASSVDVAATNVGAAYLFQLEANGTATFLEKLTAPDAAAGNFFGHSVSQFGARLAVGSPFSDTSGKTDAGAAYVFRNRLWGNHKPVFSNASFAQFENNATSFFANASDLDPEDITAYSKSGPDAPLFTINVATGELYFTTPPDFENPVDSDGDNRYMVEVTASDGISNTMQEFVVRVHNALEGSEKPPFVSVDLSGGAGAAAYPVTYLNERPDDWNSSVYKTDKILLKWIAPGTFTMGQTGIENPFQVTQGVEFYIGVYETTGSQYAKVTGSDPSGKGGGMKPVENVNWEDLRGGVWPDGGPAGTSFLGKLRSKTSGAFFDLPTEAQWEYAARAGGATTFSHGDGNATLGDYAWYLANSVDTTHEVGLKLPNPWGLYDLHGNVWEWCLDWRSAYAGGAVVDPVGSKSGTVKINRGGSYNDSSDWARLSHRGDLDPTARYTNKGMRLVLNHSGRLTNRTPTDITAGSTAVSELESVGTLVGDFNASDPEANATHIFSLVQGSGSDQNNLFDVDANGTLTTKVILDYEVNATLSIRVRATDDYNASFEKVFAIEVLNVNETPVITQGASLSVVMDEDEQPLSWSSQWANQVLGASDPDGDLLTWTLLTPAAHGTATVSGTGASPSVVVYSPNLDYSGSDSFVIKASDLNNSSDTVTINVTLSPISDPPVFIGPVGSSFSVTVFENNTFVLDLNASDDLASGGRDNPGIPEASLNWSVSGADSSFFDVHSNSGELSFKNPPDFDFPVDAGGNNVYELTVTVDDGGLSASQDLNVTVTDLNEPPVISQGASVSVVMDEDGDPMAWPLVWPSQDLNGTDPEGDVITWSLQTAPVHGTVTMGGTGATPTTFSYSPNADYNGTDSFVVKLSDGLLSDSIIINVRINPRPENGLIPLAKILTYDLQIPDANNFLFTGGGYSGIPDPDLVLMEGVNYRFSPKIGDHPLFIGSSAGVPYAGNELTGNGAEGPDGILSFIPNENTPRQLVYYCAADGTMRGDIKIISARQNKLVRPNPRPGDQFGISMSVLGNQVLVGSNGESRNGLSNTGSAHLFERDLNGEWLSVQAFRANSPEDGGRLGRDVSLGDNLVVAGAPGHDSVAGLKGVAYVFEKNATAWSQTAKLSPSDGAIHDYFGQSVSARTNRVLVGAHMADPGGVSAAGAAYIFEKSGNGTWLEKTKLAPDDYFANGHYGVSVSLDGDLALVGASGGSNANGVSTGAAYLIGRTETDTWVQITKLTPDDGVANDQFGQSVKLDGNFSYVGARLRDEGGVQDTGAVYVFQRLSNGQWVQQSKITPAIAGAEGYFGQSLDVRDNRLLVGAPGKIGDHAKSNPGYAYLFERDGIGNWTQKAKFVGYDGLSDDEMGFDVALGVSIFAGVPLRDDRGEDSGGAYVFDNSNWNDLPPVFSSEDDLTITMDEDGEPLAWVPPNVTASDPNGDVLSWRAYYENPSEANGTVVVFGTGVSPEAFQYRPKNNFHGTDTFVLEVSDGLYLKKLKVVVTVNGQADEGKPVVRMMPGFQQSSLYANAKVGAPIAIWGSVESGIPPFDYSLDFGDGQSVQGSVTDARFVGMDHQYQTSGLKTAVLTITDSIGQLVEANTQVRVFLPSRITLNETRNMAMDRGLLYLYLNAVDDVQTHGLKWFDSKQDAVYTTATTGFALMSFTSFGHSALTDSKIHAYGEVVRKALRYLTENEAVGIKDIPDHSDGVAVRQSDDPTGKVAGKGAYLVETGGHDAYSNSIALLALLNAFPEGDKASETLVVGGPFASWTYREVAEEAIQLLIWAQGDGNTRGGWEYRLTQDQPQYDGSVQQWPVIALKTAQEKWGLDVPTWVKDNIDHAYAAITNANGAVGYRSNSHWLNVTKTGGRLVSDAWMGRSPTDPLVVPSISFISDRWMTTDGWTRGLYAAYGVKKGLEATGLKMIQTPKGQREWDVDMSSWLLGIEDNLDPSMNPSKREKEKGFGQYDDGHWQGYRSSTLSTALALGVLSRGVTDFPPMPEASFPQSVSANKPFFIDGSKSYHSDPSRSITDWKWKWNWSGSANSIDWNSPDAIGLRPTHPGFASTGQGEFAMKVTDNGYPAKSSVKVFSISVSPGNHPAIPEPILFSRLPVYSARVNHKLVVDGGSSLDLDLYDSVTGYSWDINGTGVFQEGSRVIELGPYGHTFQGQVGLRVRDEDLTTWSDPKYVDLYVAEQDLNIVVMEVDPFNLQDSNFTIRLTVENDGNSSGVIQSPLVRFFDGNPFTVGRSLGVAPLPDLAPSGQGVASLTLPISSWTPQVFVFVDPYQRVPEWDESNNIGEFAIVPNYPPHDLSLTETNLLENQPAGTLTAKIHVVDVDDLNGTGSYHYELASGLSDVNNSGFYIQGNKLFSARVFDYEERNLYNVRLRVYDDKNASFEKTLPVPVGNVDDHIPVLHLHGEQEVYHEAFDKYIDAGAYWTDAIDAGGVVVSTGTSVGQGVVDIGTPGPYQLYYDAVDSAGNEADRIFRLVTVRDTTKPNIFLQGLPEIALEAFSPYVDPGALWVDVLDGFGVVEANGTIDLSKPGTYVLRYNSTDAAGNVADEVTRTVVVSDTTPPVIQLNGTSAFIHEVGQPYLDPGAIWTDAVDGNGILMGIGSVNHTIPGTYHLTYSFTDSSGNAALPAVRTVYALDRTSPIISIYGGGHLVMEAGTPYLDAGAIWLDAVDGNGSLQANETVNVNVPGTYVLSYEFVDAEGNAALPRTRTVTVMDTINPVISLTGESTVMHEAATPYVDAGAIWSDTLDGNGSVTASGLVNVNVLGTYLLTYDFKDASGNAAKQAKRMITVVDTTNPIINLIEDQILTHEVLTAYVDPGAIWSDTLDGNGTLVASGSVNVNVPRTYFLTYDFVDAHGNAAVPVTRVVKVMDTTRPVITLTGNSSVFHEAGTPYTDFGATWLDAFDGSGSLVASGLVNENVPGTYLLSYDYTDAAGNAASRVIRTVAVVDTTSPVITLTGNPSVLHEAATAFKDSGAIVNNLVDGSISILGSGQMNVKIPGSYELTYDFTDAAGNPAKQVTRIVKVVDTTKPVISLVDGVDSVRVPLHMPFVVPELTAIDSVDGNLTSEIKERNDVNVDWPGVYESYIDVSDAAGNAAETVTVSVEVFNENPTGLHLSNDMVEENLPAGTLVGRLSTDDPNDVNGTHTYSHSLLEGGEIFSLSVNGSLKTRRPLDFESQEIHLIKVKSVDMFDGRLEQEIEIRVMDAFTPIVETYVPVVNNSNNMLLLVGKVLDEGTSQGISEQGFVLGLQPDPKLDNPSNTVLWAERGADRFSLSPRNLSVGEVYFYRAFATNTEGVGYGTQESFVAAKEPEGPFWANAEVSLSAPNWWMSSWFGNFFLAENGWINHEALGWLYPTPSSGNGVWFSQEKLGWVWTAPGIFPYLYVQNDVSWHYFFGEVEGRSVFYRYADGVWLDLTEGKGSQ